MIKKIENAIQSFDVKLSGLELGLEDGSFDHAISNYRKQASILYKKKKFSFEGEQVQLLADWSKSFNRTNSVSEIDGILRIQVNLSNLRSVLHRPDIASYFIEHFLYEIYICMN